MRCVHKPGHGFSTTSVNDAQGHWRSCQHLWHLYSPAPVSPAQCTHQCAQPVAQRRQALQLQRRPPGVAAQGGHGDNASRLSVLEQQAAGGAVRSFHTPGTCASVLIQVRVCCTAALDILALCCPVTLCCHKPVKLLPQGTRGSFVLSSAAQLARVNYACYATHVLMHPYPGARTAAPRQRQQQPQPQQARSQSCGRPSL